MARTFDIDGAVKQLQELGLRTEELVTVKDMVIHQKDGAFPKGFNDIETFADTQTQPGRAIIRAGTVVNKSMVPSEIWDHWLKTERVVSRIRLTVLTTESKLRRLVQLVYSIEETEVMELAGHGGFNVTKNYNLGAHVVGTEGTPVSLRDGGETTVTQPTRQPPSTRRKVRR